MTLSATRKADYLSRAKKTSENFPLPSDGPSSKSSSWNIFSILEEGGGLKMSCDLYIFFNFLCIVDLCMCINVYIYSRC